MQHRTCSVEDCGKEPRSRYERMCPMHYHRWYRHGSVHATAATSGVTASKGRKYRVIHDRAHPLAMANGNVYEHRAALFSVIGYGPHACHWCERPINWRLPRPHALHVDHLNGETDDNDPSNLVPSCARCNTLRGVQARSDALRAAGFWAHHDTVQVTSPRAPRVESRPVRKGAGHEPGRGGGGRS